MTQFLKITQIIIFCRFCYVRVWLLWYHDLTIEQSKKNGICGKLIVISYHSTHIYVVNFLHGGHDVTEHTVLLPHSISPVKHNIDPRPLFVNVVFLVFLFWLLFLHLFLRYCCPPPWFFPKEFRDKSISSRWKFSRWVAIMINTLQWAYVFVSGS